MATPATLRASFRPAPAARLGSSSAARQQRLQLAPAAVRRPAATAAGSGGSDPFQGLNRNLSRTASDLKAKLEDFARQQRLQERVNSGLSAASRAAEKVAAEAGQAAKKVDAEYDVSGKAADAARAAEEAARRLGEAAEDADARYQVRGRAQNLWRDIKRGAPAAGRAIRDFFETPLGAVTFLFLFLISVFTGAFWVILRVLFVSMWIFILLSPLIINYMNARAIQRQQRMYREHVMEQKRRQEAAGPFYGTVFEDFFAGTRSEDSVGGGGSSARGFGRAPRGYESGSDADVIDVQAQRLDD